MEEKIITKKFNFKDLHCFKYKINQIKIAMSPAATHFLLYDFKLETGWDSGH
jgi:hypothetical protein